MVSSRLKPFGTTVFAEISARAKARGAVDLGQGRPDFDGPEFVRQAAARAVERGPNQYAPMPGIPELRQAIAQRCQAAGWTADADREITVTSGCTEALAATCLGLFERGDRVVVLEPFYDAYLADLALAGAEPVFVSLRRQSDGGFAFDPAELQAACQGARAIMLNTPHNPTGKVFTEAELRQIGSLAIQNNLVVVSDEVYDALTYDGTRHVSIATLPGLAERTITLGSFGKMFTMTGWKIGWAIAPAELTAAIRSAHQFLTFAVSTPMQAAAAEAIASPESVFEEIRTRYQQKRDRLADGLADAGLQIIRPASGYFILASHEPWSASRGLATDLDICRWLIDEIGVATIPPSSFYAKSEEGTGLLRFAFCKTDATLDAAIARLAQLGA